MNRVGWIVVATLAFATPGRTWAAAKDTGKQKEVVQKIEALNKDALASFKAGDHDEAKSKLMDALVMGKKNDLDKHPVIASTYLDLGVVHSEGLKDYEKAQRYFGLALRIKPDIELPKALASDTVTSEFEKARDNPPSTTGGGAGEARADDSGRREAETARSEAAAARREADAARREAAHESQAEKERLRDELARVQEAEKRQRESAERLEKSQRATDEQLTAVKENEKKQREAAEKLQKDNAEAQKRLASLKDSETKERETRERLEKQLAEIKDNQQKEKQLAETREKERKAQEEKERLSREKLAEGPDMPSSIPQPLYCPTADEGQQGTDIYLYCVTQPGIKAKEAAVYYRRSGSLHFNSVAAQRSKKGWWVAVVPAGYTNTKVLQYYVEIGNDRGEVVASYGRSKSPNIMILKPAGAPIATATRDTGGSLVRAHSVDSKPAPSRKTPAKKR
jgi:hypothetical protein